MSRPLPVISAQFATGVLAVTCAASIKPTSAQLFSTKVPHWGQHPGSREISPHWVRLQAAVLRCFVKIAASSLRRVVAKRFIREKREQAILENRPAGAAAQSLNRFESRTLDPL